MRTRRQDTPKADNEDSESDDEDTQAVWKCGAWHS